MTKYKAFFQDKDEHIVLWQSPNILLIGWAAFKVMAMLLGTGRLKTGFEHLGTALIFAWAYFEATEGVNYFRKALGLTILVVITVGFFK